MYGNHVIRSQNKQSFSVLFPNISLLTSSQGKPQELVSVPVDGIQDPYLATLDLSTSENLNIYNKAIFGLPESDRYDLTRFKCTDFYQELEDDVSTFGFKLSVLVVTDTDAGNAPTEVKNIILSYPSITQIMV